MWRREFILGLGGAAFARCGVAHAQQAAMPLVGYLSNGTPAGFSQLVAAFRRGLNEAGYVEGRNVKIEFRWAEGREDQLPALSAELIRLQPSVIAATGGSSPAVAARMATRTIPIVFTGGQDPGRRANAGRAPSREAAARRVAVSPRRRGRFRGWASRRRRVA